MSAVLTYRPMQDNLASLTKNALDLPQFSIDWSAGMPGGTTISSAAGTAINEAGTDSASVILGTLANSGTTTTVPLKTGGTSGTGAATDKARFRIRIIATLSNSRQLQFDVFLIVAAPAYDPI